MKSRDRDLIDVACNALCETAPITTALFMTRRVMLRRAARVDYQRFDDQRGDDGLHLMMRFNPRARMQIVPRNLFSNATAPDPVSQGRIASGGDEEGRRRL
jgi:hypothetical protein